MSAISIAYDADRYGQMVRQTARRLRAHFTAQQIVQELGRYYPEEDIRITVTAVERVPLVTRRGVLRLTLEGCLWMFLVAKLGALFHVMTQGVPQGNGYELGLVFFVLAPAADVAALVMFYCLNRISYLAIGLTLVVFLPAFTGFNETVGSHSWLSGTSAGVIYVVAFWACAALLHRDTTVLSVRDILRRDGLA